MLGRLSLVALVATLSVSLAPAPAAPGVPLLHFAAPTDATDLPIIAGTVSNGEEPMATWAVSA